MKSIKKILLVLILLISFLVTFSNAASSDVTFSVEDESTATISFGSNSYIERSVVSKDLDNKELTLQLKVVNNETTIKPSGELMLVIDNSDSMKNEVSTGVTRYDLVISSAKTLITNLLEDNDNLKIGIVSFSSDSTKDDNGKYINEGSLTDASLVSNLSNDSSTLLTAVSNIEYNGARTNLDAGITLAKSYFTDSTNTSSNYVIVLTDGVPNLAIDYDGYYYSDDVIEKTNTSLKSLSNVSDNVFVMLTGITNDTEYATRLKAEEDTKTYGEIIEEIFGTTTNPTVGTFYYIDDSEIEETINTIYNSLLPTSLSFTDLIIIDTFTDEIVNNFDFSYVKEPNLGTISDSIDTSTNSIVWNIPELTSGKTAIVQYKLKLKDGFDDSIIGKVLDTNSNLSITYTDSSGVTNTKNTDVTPKVKLTEILPTTLPKAGKDLLISIVGILFVIAIVTGIRYIVLNKEIK